MTTVVQRMKNLKMRLNIEDDEVIQANEEGNTDDNEDIFINSQISSYTYWGKA